MIIDKINSLNNLTIQEKTLVDYINTHPEAIVKLGIIDLAKMSYTSTSTIIRLCKKIGLNGYSQLKYIYALEYNDLMHRFRELKKEPFNGEESIDDIISMLPIIYSRSIEYTKSLIQRNDIIRVTNLIKQSDRIEIYGNGLNYELGKLLAYRFEGVYKDCFVYNVSHWDHISYLSVSKKKVVAILLSSTGENEVIIDAASRLKKQNIPLISITKKNSQLESMCDYNFYVMEAHSELELSYPIEAMAVQYFGDICTSSLLVHQYPTIANVINRLRNEK